MNGVLETYRLNGRTRHELFRYAVIGCVRPNPCEAPKGVSSDFAENVLQRFKLVPDEE